MNKDSGDSKTNELYFGFLKREADTLVIPEINLEPLPQSHNQIRYQPLRSHRVSARNAVVKIRNQVSLHLRLKICGKPQRIIFFLFIIIIYYSTFNIQFLVSSFHRPKTDLYRYMRLTLSNKGNVNL